MIEDLKEIKEKQEYIVSVLVSANVIGANSSLQHAREEAIACLDKLDAVIQRLDSEELVEIVAEELWKYDFEPNPQFNVGIYKNKAQATINTIKGKEND